jgi:3D (Asp-Asp-Asp) domain-containing protein
VSHFLRFTLIFCVALLVGGCAGHAGKQANKKKSAGKRMAKVRTTAYTHTETGGSRNAIGSRLSGKNIMSAASDWSRFPLGTRFRIPDTNEEFIIDDYGSALVGTDTIDLYKTTRLAMNRWGVRHVDIDILEWGSDEQSLKILAPRCRSHRVKRMVAALQQRKRTVSTLTSF